MQNQYPQMPVPHLIHPDSAMPQNPGVAFQPQVFTPQQPTQPQYAQQTYSQPALPQQYQPQYAQPQTVVQPHPTPQFVQPTQHYQPQPQVQQPQPQQYQPPQYQQPQPQPQVQQPQYAQPYAAQQPVRPQQPYVSPQQIASTIPQMPQPRPYRSRTIYSPAQPQARNEPVAVDPSYQYGQIFSMDMTDYNNPAVLAAVQAQRPTPRSDIRNKLITIFLVPTVIILAVGSVFAIGVLRANNSSKTTVNPSVATATTSKSTTPVTPAEEESNQERQDDIQAIQTQVEAYYTLTGHYPAYADMNNSAFTSMNFPSLAQAALVAPGSTSPTFADKPTKEAYSYEATGPDGVSCDNVATNCNSYTLTALLADGTPFDTSSQN